MACPEKIPTDGILLDLDGTLWDATEGILYTWNSVITRSGIRPPLSMEELTGVLGMQMDEIAQKLFPMLEGPWESTLLGECVRAENEYLYDHCGRLYPGVEEGMRSLSVRVPLFVVSNCQKGYIEAFLHASGLGDAVTGTLCYGDTGEPKHANMRAVAARHGLKKPIYVGDTIKDYRETKMAGMPFIHAAYGFGVIGEEVPSIGSFGELAGLLALPEKE